MVPVGVVEVCGTFTGKLEVLLLIMANRDMSCSRENVLVVKFKIASYDGSTCGLECRQPEGLGMRRGRA